MTLPLLDPTATAVVTIDMHRGHLDPTVATMPLPAEAAARVTAANAHLIHGARSRGIPVVHVVTSYHDVAEIASNPWWRRVAGTDATRSNVLNHQLPGSPGLQVMPGLLDEADVVVYHKKRYDCFVATELDHVLRARQIESLLLTGVNTNSCVLATTVAANARDYAAVVVEDCVDTMDRSLHDPALALIRQAFGWTATADEILEAL
ncbi:cysteine hydrolase family protein [Mycobacterium sp. NPDC003449]